MIGEYNCLCKLEIITSVIELNLVHGANGKAWWNSNKLLNGNVNSYSTNYNTSNRTTIEINLGDRANSVQALLMDKNRMIYISAYTDGGKNITEIKISTIYGEKVTPSVNNTVISVSIGSWITGTALISYSINKPTFSIK